MPDIAWWLLVAVTIAGCRQGYLWHRDHLTPPLDPFWTDQA